MELTSLKEIREDYLKSLSKDPQYNDILNKLANKKENEPIYSIKELNYEEPPNYDNEQRELLEISLDLNSINNGVIQIKNKVAELISYLDSNIEAVKDTIQKEDERISDINMICGENSEYNMVAPIYAQDFTEGDTNFENIKDKYFGAILTSQNKINYEIVNISGNGIIGNPYVYKNNSFENETNDYSDYNYINDDNDITKFEYSRYVTNDKTEVIDNVINYDDKDVNMTIILYSSERQFNKIEWLSENNDLIVKDLATSDDGVTFTTRIKNSIKVNNPEIIYNDSTYIYGSDILCFPYCSYIRVTFSSSNNCNDVLGIKTDNNQVKMLPNSRRKKIVLNTIKLYNSNYSNANLVSDNIIVGGNVDKATLFCSEYIPNHFVNKNYITYYLIINGTEHQVVPVNSGKKGIKLIKFREVNTSIQEEDLEVISETIKSIQVKIVINVANSHETPYIGNIKLCLGKESGSIYV